MSIPASGLSNPAIPSQSTLSAPPMPPATAPPANMPPLKLNIQRPAVFQDMFTPGTPGAASAGKAPAPAPVNKAGHVGMGEGLKLFGKGMLAPFAAFFKHPVKMGALMVGGMAMAHWMPVTVAPILVVGGALSLFEAGKSLLKLFKARQAGDNAGMREALLHLGTASSAGLLIAAGNKGGASITAESKAALAATQSGRSATEVATLSGEAFTAAKSGSFLAAARENVSVFTSKEGFAALRHTFTPTSFKQNFHIPFVTKHSAATHVHPQVNSNQAKGVTGFISSFIDDLVILSFAKQQDHEH